MARTCCSFAVQLISAAERKEEDNLERQRQRQEQKEEEKRFWFQLGAGGTRK